MGRWRHGLHVWRAALLARTIRSMGKCVHLHAHFVGSAATTALATARLLEVGFSFTNHTSWASTALDVKLREAAFVASISEYDRQFLLENVDAVSRDAIAGKIHVIHCGLPFDEWVFAPKYREADKNESVVPTILSVGAVEAVKGHDILIRACRLLRDQGVRFQCRIVGGFAGMDLKPLVEKLNLQETVVLLGALPQEEVRKELLNCDVFALACRRLPNGNSDGVPVSLMEPMALGRPVVSTPIAGIPELVIDGKTGFMANPDDPSSLAEKLRLVLESKLELDKIIQQARNHVERYFDADKEAAKLISLFQKYYKARINI